VGVSRQSQAWKACVFRQKKARGHPKRERERERERKQDLREMPSKRSVEQATVKKRAQEQESAIPGAQEEEKSAKATRPKSRSGR